MSGPPPGSTGVSPVPVGRAHQPGDAQDARAPRDLPPLIIQANGPIFPSGLPSSATIAAYSGLVDEDLSAGSLYRMLRTRYGLQIAYGERNLEAVAAGQWEARLLEVALASPLLLLESVAYLPDGRAFEYSRALHRGDRARIEVEFRPAPDDA